MYRLYQPFRNHTSIATHIWLKSVTFWPLPRATQNGTLQSSGISFCSRNLLYSKDHCAYNTRMIAAGVIGFVSTQKNKMRGLQTIPELSVTLDQLLM